METTRFAPSPSGLLHLGHAHAALFAARAAGAGGRFLLRIEDIDTTRCRPDFEQAIAEDLAWLGLTWERPVLRQSEHFARYGAALERLRAEGLLYPCFCTRAEIRAAMTAPHAGEALYPGTCRHRSAAERQERLAAGQEHAWRLDLAEAVCRAGPLAWHDLGRGEQPARPELLGDAVLGRKDIAASYHLCVVLDDALQEVSLVTRGEDLFEATHLHRLLQALFGLPVPRWHHHGLLADAAGRRLAKRHDALSLRALRESGLSAAEARARAGFPPFP